MHLATTRGLHHRDPSQRLDSDVEHEAVPVGRDHRVCPAGEARAAGVAHALFDADALPGGLVLRSPAPGDRVRLLAGGTRKLQDVLVDAKVPRETRALLPVLAAGAEILWVPGLARGAGAPVGPATTRVVEAVFERDP